MGRFLLSLIILGTAFAQAHFQLIYTPDIQRTKAGDVSVVLLFWHPFENGHVMDMAQPAEFFMRHRGEDTDLLDTLTSVTFQGVSNAAAAYTATIPVKRNGDYVLALTPAPYFEASEDIYIQQITKSYLNKGTLPTDWAEPLDLPTEILPLNKPTNIITGSTFTAQVLSEGQPVAGAEIEIEYMVAEPDLDTLSPASATASPMPGGTLVAISDAQGYFTFGIPKAGFWGFAALGVGPDTQFEGKDLSQDAVIWIRAYDLP